MRPCQCMQCRINRLEEDVDRVTEKLAQAAGVVPRSNASLEAEADRLIAREAEFEKRKAAAFAPHHALLDGRHRQMDQLEDSLKIVSNADPLQISEDGSQDDQEGHTAVPALDLGPGTFRAEAERQIAVARK